MASTVIWSVGTTLLAVIVIRAVRVGLLGKYPLFYAYITCVLVKAIVDRVSYVLIPNFYAALYWSTELATIIASYAVIIEICQQSLKHNPGIARKAPKLLFSVFALTLSYAATDLLHGRWSSAYRLIVDLGRDLRYIEGALLLVMLWLFVRYRIPFNRNALGLVGGYSFWVGVNVVNLIFWSLPGKESSLFLRALVQITYVATLAIWCLTLWSCQPEIVRPDENAIERDYHLLASKTRSVLARSSVHLLRAMRP